MMPTANQPFVD